MKPVGKPSKIPVEDKSGLDKVFSKTFRMSSTCLDAIIKLGSIPTFLTSYALSSLTSAFILHIIKSVKEDGKKADHPQVKSENIIQKKSPESIKSAQDSEVSAKIKAQTAEAFKEGQKESKIEHKEKLLRSISRLEEIDTSRVSGEKVAFVRHGEDLNYNDEYSYLKDNFYALFKGPIQILGRYIDFNSFLNETLPEIIGQISLKSEKTIVDGLRDAIVGFSLKYKKANIPKKYNQNSLICAFETSEAIYIANLGNSRALLVESNGNFKQLTIDQDPSKKGLEAPDSYPIITKIMKKKRDDEESKPEEGIIYAQEGDYLILGTEALWANATNDQVALAINNLKERKTPSQEMGLFIIDALQKSGMQDNISVAVIPIEISPLRIKT